jgi:hypothetical protein
MKFLIFLTALSAIVLDFALMTSFQRAFTSFGKGHRLDGVQVNVEPSNEAKQPSVLTAILIVIAPTRFDPFRHQSPAGQYK